MDPKRKTPDEFARSAAGRFFLGGLPVLGGILTVLVSLDVLAYVDLHPNRIAIFNDPHTWQVFAVGTLMTSFGLAFLIPREAKRLGRLNTWVLLAAFLAVVVGVVLAKLS